MAVVEQPRGADSWRVRWRRPNGVMMTLSFDSKASALVYQQALAKTMKRASDRARSRRPAAAE